MKVIIIGGVAGGASTAARLRRLDETAEIIMFEKGEYISFANCGLPYYLSGTIENKEDLVVQTPESLGKRFNLDIRIRQEVTEINRTEKTVIIHDYSNDNTYKEKYDKLVLSPGAKAFIPPIKGLDSKKVFSLRDIPDVLSIKNYIKEKKPRRIVVFGAGYIGIEIAENLKKAGLTVTIIELMNQILGPLDYEMATLVHQHLKENEVEFYLSDPVQGIKHEGSCQILELESGQKVKTDMVIMGVGVRPENSLAKEAGLEIGITGGIEVNDYLQTSDPDIYAVGDAIEVSDYISGNPALIPLAGPANKQGRIVAGNIYGHKEKYNGTQGTSIIKVFDMTIATTGNNEKILKKNGINYEKSYTHSPSHAGYYPGAEPISLKLLFSPNGKILGAQAVGKEGVDKRIDVIATAIRSRMKVADLEELELCYAPPYGSAKDPVNMAGYVANNILKGDVEIFHWDEFKNYNSDNSIILDVRKPDECKEGMIEGAINIPLDELRDRLHELDKNKIILIYCQVGLRGYLAYRLLKLKGFNRVRNLSGGYKTYFPTTCRQDNCPLYSYEKILKSDIMEASKKNHSV
jgi:NADPH-dependent 2,4-dienoyl-CoA reductase/sulfur reductase-like enzyme/rhodanese-related sulfurtransferase